MASLRRARACAGAWVCLQAAVARPSAAGLLHLAIVDSRRPQAAAMSTHGAFHATPVSLQQGAAKKKPAGPSSAAAPAVEEKYDLTKQIPVNLLKEGAEPEYKPDSEYPEWVFKLLDEKPLLEDFVMKGLENVPEDKMKMVLRMASKRKIKEANDARRKIA